MVVWGGGIHGLQASLSLKNQFLSLNLRHTIRFVVPITLSRVVTGFVHLSSFEKHEVLLKDLLRARTTLIF